MIDCGYEYSGFATLYNKTSFTYYGLFNNVPGFIYGDGTYASIRPYSLNDSRDELQLLTTDINGPVKPNIIGRDVFQFQINISKGTIIGYCDDGNKCTVDKIKNSNEYSRCCARKILEDGWEITDDYPW